MAKDLKKDKLNELIDQFNESKNNHRNFYFRFLGNMHPFYDENGRTCQIINCFQFRLGVIIVARPAQHKTCKKKIDEKSISVARNLTRK